jgi:PAS domain S-box-containing protein
MVLSRLIFAGAACLTFVALINGLVTGHGATTLIGGLVLSILAALQLVLRRPDPALPLLVAEVLLLAFTGSTLSLAVGFCVTTAGLAVVVPFIRRPLIWIYGSAAAALWLGQLVVVPSADWGPYLGVMGAQLLIFAMAAGGLFLLARFLQGAEVRYRQIFEQAPISLWHEDFTEVGSWLETLRAEGVSDLAAYLVEHPEEVRRAASLVKVTDINPMGVELIDAEEPASIVGRIDSAHIADAALAAWISQFEAIWEGRSSTSKEIEGLTVRGGRIDGVVYWSAAGGADQLDLANVVVSIADVSNLKDAKRALAESNALMNAVAEALARFIGGASPGDALEHLLGTFIDLTDSEGGSVAEVVMDPDGGFQVPLSRVVGSIDTERVDRLMQDVVTSAGSVRLDRSAEGPAYVALPLWWQSEMVGVVTVATGPERDGDLAARLGPVFATASNIIHAKRVEEARQDAEQRLRENEERFRLLLQNMSDLTIMLDRRGRIAYITPSVERILGYRPDELIGVRSLFDFVHPDDVEAVLATGRLASSGATVGPLEFRLRRRDDTWRSVEATGTNLIDRSPLHSWVVNAHDITERKRSEEQLRAAKEAAEGATQTKSEFLANMSHEIRTPMNAILGMTELVLGTDLNEEQQEYLGTARSAVDSLLTLINDILDLSKIEAGRLEIASLPFSLRDALTETIRTLVIRAAEKGIELRYQLDAGVPDSVVGDPGRLRQVLFNLVGNAVKFTNDGEVAVQVSALQVDEDATELHFAVRDTGVGIPQTKLASIFDAFTQVDGSTTRRFGGTGLGLTIVSQLVEAMGGRVWAESEVGQGSAFHFTVQLGRQDPAMIAAQRGAQSEALGVLVLGVVEESRSKLCQILAHQGFSPVAARTAAEAAVIVANLAVSDAAPDLLVLAVESTEDQFLEEVLDHPSLGGIPVVVVAESAARGDGERASALGASGYFGAPIVDTDLLEAVRLVAAAGRTNQALPLVTRHWLREQRQRLTVLLADDSPTNRQLAVRLLELRGHVVVAVEDGAEAVRAMEGSPFNVVLMDVQMPVMDGFAATREIRLREQVIGGRVPIIALTAHAMEGDRERCLAAGMDEYLAKPFRADELYAIIDSVVPVPSGAITTRPSVAHTVEGAGLDEARALESVGGSAELLTEITGLFLDEYAEQSAVIASSLEAGEMDRARKAAHRVKGSLGSLGSDDGFEAAKALEFAARDEDMPAALAAWDKLRHVVAAAMPDLRRLAGVPNKPLEPSDTD